MLFISNNSTQTREQSVAKIRAMGIEIRVEEMFSSGYATGLYLQQHMHFAAGETCLVLGEAGLVSELRAGGAPAVVVQQRSLLLMLGQGRAGGGQVEDVRCAGHTGPG